MIGTLQLLEDVLAGCGWGLEQDFGYLWALEHDGRCRELSLHLHADPSSDEMPGLLFARERGGGADPIGVVLAGQVSASHTAALVTALLDERGTADLRALDRLLAATTGVLARA